MRYFCVGICSIFFMACSEQGIVFSEERLFSNETWSYAEPIVFEIPVSDTTTSYQLLMDVSYSTDFDFQNLYVNVTTSFPDKKKIDDVLSLELADDRGLWNGKCSATECTAPILLRNNFRFQQTGIHTISFDQHSRKDNLRGLKAFRLKLIEDAL